ISVLGSSEQKGRWLPAIASGDLIATIAVLEESDDLSEAGVELAATPSGAGVSLSGRKLFVPSGQAADLFLVAAREPSCVSLCAVPRDPAGVTVTALRLIDQTQRAAVVALDGVQVDASARLGQAGRAWPQLSKVLDAATVALAAEMVGAADAALRLASE